MLLGIRRAIVLFVYRFVKEDVDGAKSLLISVVTNFIVFLAWRL